MKFECLKCGSCCKNLLEDIEGFRRGMVLTIKESNLFPPKMVSPLMAVGINKPEKIILFQLNVNNCPYIDNENQCKIYVQRPLMCQAFPVDKETYSIRCKAINSPNIGESFPIGFESYQIEASDKLNRYIMSHYRKYFKKDIAVWSFDLARKEWIFRNRYEKNVHGISF